MLIAVAHQHDRKPRSPNFSETPPPPASRTARLAHTSGGRDESGKLIPIDVKVGDRILFGKWSGTEVEINDVQYLIMKESDIMGVLVEAEAKKKAA